MENETEVKQECRTASRCATLKKSGLLFGPARN